jgi:hypothetical protein
MAIKGLARKAARAWRISARETAGRSSRRERDWLASLRLAVMAEYGPGTVGHECAKARDWDWLAYHAGKLG